MMAANKEEILSPEEMLQNALVPDWEQPYKVPKNWVWTRLRHVISTSKDKTEQFSDKQKYVGLEHIGKGVGIIGYSDASEVKSVKNVFKKGEILYGKLRPYLNKHAIADFDGVSSTDILVFNATTPIHSELANYFFDLDIFINYTINNSKGINLPRVSEDAILQFPFPLPPLAEQQRIVDRIDSLFPRLNEAKEKAQIVLDSFENRKAAILHKAFTGELTKKWRGENGVSWESWEEKEIKNVCSFRAGFAFDSQKFSNHGYQVIRMGNLYNGILDLQRNPVFIPLDKIDEKTLQRSMINQGDILLTLTGTKYKRDYGYAVLIDVENLLLNQRIVALTPTKINTKFLLYSLQSNYFRDIFFSNETGGVSQGNVSSKFVEQIKIKYPTFPEQSEIVRILDSIFEKEQKAKEFTDVIEKIDLMKKAILARAFLGKLYTNDPNEESAKQLLKSILSDKINIVPIVKEKGKAKEEASIIKLEEVNVTKTILETLSEHNSLTPEKLKAQTDLDIDAFYAELKNLVDTGKVIERREGDESYLEVSHAGRQA
jgi:type I restriction enzyme S subunit